MRVLVFGDGIAYGEYDTQGGWVDRLKVAYFDKRLTYTQADIPAVYNLGVASDTARSLAARLSHEVVVRRSTWESDTNFVIIIAIGINDSLIDDDGAYVSTPERYFHELEDLYAMAHLFSEKILFVGLTP